MIATLTAHPSIDLTVTLAGRLERGAVLRADRADAQAGGKGVNISRAAAAAGVPTLAVLPADADDPFVLELVAAGVPAQPVGPAGGAIRTNITISEADGTTTKVNSTSGPASRELLAALEQALLTAAARAEWIVLAGSLPPGTPDAWYAELVARLAQTPARVAVDTSDEPLRILVERLAPGSAPHLLKPNADELASLTGHGTADLEDDPAVAARAARELLDRGVDTVLVTLGGAGAVLATGAGTWHATVPPTTVVSTVGAGDSSLFGYLLGDLRQLAPEQRLALAVAYGSAAAGLPGTTIPTPSQVHPELVSVRSLDPTEGALR
jgi:1-phosphofructokinase